MPWQETNRMNQRVRFMAAWLSGDVSKSALCATFGISRPTGDKWISRYQAEGTPGLTERSRAPHRHSHAVSPSCVERIIAAKLTHQDWGPKKVMDWLRRRDSSVSWPVDSTAGEILKRAGLVRPRRRRRIVPSYDQPFAACQYANQSWSADFKGDFCLTNHQRCWPLTISDNFSRYVLACRALRSTSGTNVLPWFEWVFREYGLPLSIRTDNGVPFASLALGGLSRLSIYWIRLGIRPERIAKGKPSQNGRHERMHRTLKQSGIPPVQNSFTAQQDQFERWRREFNQERSHEAIGRQPPSTLYQPALRSYPSLLPAVEYDAALTVRAVRSNGQIKWRGEHLFISELLDGQPVGLKQIDEQCWELFYSFYRLGYLTGSRGTYSIETQITTKPKV